MKTEMQSRSYVPLPYQSIVQARAHPYKDLVFFQRGNHLQVDASTSRSVNYNINLEAEISAQRIEIRWDQFSSQDVKYTITAECMSANFNLRNKEAESRWKKKFDLPWSQRSTIITTTPGSVVRISIECINLTDENVICREDRDFKACMNLKEHAIMYQKAVDYAKTDMHQFHEVYRCKPKFYWDYIHEENGGIMEKYIKDENGQPSNQINGLLSGLFFSARLTSDLHLPTTSPFGNVRMLLEADKLLNPKTHNFYFADFYCNYKSHYITIVVCRKGSLSDSICSSKCFPLNIFDNPFLKVKYQYLRGRPIYQYFVNYFIWVEVYYTENIHLNEGRFHDVIATGAGTAKIGGLPNNKSCTVCNLYPAKSISSIAEENSNSLSVDLTIDEFQLQNSTFICLCSMDKTSFENIFDDLVETVCGIVDGVCEMQEEDVGVIEMISDGVIIRSNREIAKLVKDTNKKLRSDPVFNACPKISDLWQKIKAHADSFQKCGLIGGYAIKNVIVNSAIFEEDAKPLMLYLEDSD